MKPIKKLGAIRSVFGLMDDESIKLMVTKINEVIDVLNKPVTTTNEQPKEDLENWFKDQKNVEYPIIYNRPKGCIEVQLSGMSIYLDPNGTYFLNDTSGG